MKPRNIDNLIDKAQKRLGNRNAWKAAYLLREEGEHTQKNVAPWLKLIAHEEFYTKKDHRKKQEVNRNHFSKSRKTNYVQRMADCALPDRSTGNPRYCRVRQCPICQWRRSLKWQARSLKSLESAIKEHPFNRHAVLTLTAKNCEVEVLRDKIDELNRAWVRMSKRKEVSRVLDGYIKTCEVTRGAFGTAHPHLHIILSLKSSFMGRFYIKKQKWEDLWKESLKVDYAPLIHFSLFKPTSHSEKISQIVNAVAYVTKESETTFDRDWFVAMAEQVHHTRAISLGGVFKKYMKEGTIGSTTVKPCPSPKKTSKITLSCDDMKDIGAKAISSQQVVRLGVDKAIKKKPKKKISRKTISFDVM